MSFEKIFEMGGWPALGLALVCFLLWKFLRFASKKLFDDEKGYVSRYVAAHEATQERFQKFMATEEARGKEQVAACNVHAESLAETGRDVRQLKEAALEGCKLCRVFADSHPEQAEAASVHLDAIERIISQAE